MCSNYGLKAKPTTTYNPRAPNGIIERVHQTLRDNLATFQLSNRELPEYDLTKISYIRGYEGMIRTV
jgi:transposase InsO family protein